MGDEYITILADRLVELLRAEKTAQMLLEVIKEKKEHYCGIDSHEVRLLHTLFCGYEEEVEE